MEDKTDWYKPSEKKPKKGAKVFALINEKIDGCSNRYILSMGWGVGERWETYKDMIEKWREYGDGEINVVVDTDGEISSLF